MLKAGETLETGSGRKIILGEEKVELSDEDLGGIIRHNGWTLHVPKGMHLTWPVYPFNPYKDAPETELERAIGVLSLTLHQKDEEFRFTLEAE